MMAVGIEACFHKERIGEDGATAEAYHEEMWKLFTLNFLLFSYRTLMVIDEEREKKDREE